MNRAKAKFLQEKLAQEARAALEMGGSNAPTEGYARAITLIGKVWGLNDSDANEQFDLIQQDREYVQRVEVGDSEPSSAPNKDLALNWTGMECIEVLEGVPFPVSWTVKMKKKQKETQDILSYHTQAAGCSDKARAKASGGRQPIEECGRTGL